VKSCGEKIWNVWEMSKIQDVNISSSVQLQWPCKIQSVCSLGILIFLIKLSWLIPPWHFLCVPSNSSERQQTHAAMSSIWKTVTCSSFNKTQRILHKSTDLWFCGPDFHNSSFQVAVANHWQHHSLQMQMFRNGINKMSFFFFFNLS
jgi:hypothetical protein